jgi:hypothetical protein
LALAALVTGLVMALGTPWGLFRHYWVLISLGLTVLATVVSLVHMPTVSSLADLARATDGAHRGGLGGDLVHPGLGLVVLLVITTLNVYKPRGLTRYGWRKQQEQRRKQQQRTAPVPSDSDRWRPGHHYRRAPLRRPGGRHLPKDRDHCPAVAPDAVGQDWDAHLGWRGRGGARPPRLATEP